ncbi:hypothetical protein ES703_14414 [subsurface metagenome]
MRWSAGSQKGILPPFKLADMSVADAGVKANLVTAQALV